MMKNKVKKTVAFLLTVTLAAGLLVGCNKAEERKQDKTDSGKGRYIEEDMELPLKEGEKVLSFSQSKDGNPLLFTNSSSQINRCEYIDGKWNETSVEWVSKMYQEQPLYALDMEEEADGTQVLLTIDENSQSHLVRGGGTAQGELLDVPYLSQQTEYGYPMITDLLIDAEGNYWIQDMYQYKVVAVSADTLDSVLEVETVQSFSTSSKTMAKSENGSIAVYTEEGMYTLYSGKQPQAGTTLEVNKEGEWKLCSEAENWYGVSAEGISRSQPDGEITEMLMEGSMGAMGSPLNSPLQMICGGNDDFYVLYSQDKAGTNSLAHYVYDKDISAVPEKTLTVFGLSENDTVRQAIIQFQKKNTNVRVEFNTSGKSDSEVTSDDIRTLNTELLGGNGADVLLLDGLPADSYIEKGVLEDMTGLAKEIMSENSYLGDILNNTMQKHGKLYGLPIKFSVPILYGNEETKEALTSMDTLAAYLEENPDATVFGVADYTYIENFLFQLYQDEITGKDGKIHQKKLEQLFELERVIAKNAQAEQFNSTKYNSTDKSILGMFGNVVGPAVQKFPDAVTTDEISSVSGMILPYALMKQMNISPVSVQDMYKPIGTAAVNGSSKQKELAEQFIKYLFSEEIQSAQIDDGLPVLESALQGKTNEVDTEYAAAFLMSSSMDIGGEEITIDGGYPSVEEVQSLIDLCGTLTKPVEQDRVVWNLYRETADKYLEGSVEADEAAKTIAQKVDTYLAE